MEKLLVYRSPSTYTVRDRDVIKHERYNIGNIRDTIRLCSRCQTTGLKNHLCKVPPVLVVCMDIIFFFTNKTIKLESSSLPSNFLPSHFRRHISFLTMKLTATWLGTQSQRLMKRRCSFSVTSLNAKLCANSWVTGRINNDLFFY